MQEPFRHPLSLEGEVFLAFHERGQYDEKTAAEPEETSHKFPHKLRDYKRRGKEERERKDQLIPVEQISDELVTCCLLVGQITNLI